MILPKKNKTFPGSFRDPSGVVFFQEEKIFRQVNESYQVCYEQLKSSGLYSTLVEKEWLISHEEIAAPQQSPIYKIIKPEQIPFISYPYEWSFSQLKEAALLTLKIQRKSIECNMSLKDASAYNIQFIRGKPIFIDTLSFEQYVAGEPWVAYQQFCKHFLAPLALMAYKDIRLSQLLRIYIDGIPLDLASSLLPFSTRLKPSISLHLHLHAKVQQRFAREHTPSIKEQKRKFSRFAFLALIDSLETGIKKLKWKSPKTEWGNYYQDTNYSEEAFQHKKQLVTDFLARIQPKIAWDLGANLGFFSRIISTQNIFTVAFDIDPVAVEKNYSKVRKAKEQTLLPLLLDLTNPSPGLGWKHEERMSFIERGPVELVLALALIHHLAISNHLPFSKIALFFREVCQHLVIEFIPKTDSQVKKLFSTREDIFPHYNQESFEEEFQNFFHIQKKSNIKNSERILYLMEQKPLSSLPSCSV